MNVESPAGKAHLDIMQGVIQRMAANSASCKTWCISLVSAILVVAADKGKPHVVWLALLPTLMFFLLDTYYLAFEKGFRDSYNTFVEKLHSGSAADSDLFKVALEGRVSDHQWKAMKSLSVWGFYGCLAVLVGAAFAFIR